MQRDDLLSRGILLELASAFGSEVFSAVNHLYSNRYQEQMIRTELKKTRLTYTKLNKSKRRSNAANEFLDTVIEVNVVPVLEASNVDNGTCQSNVSKSRVSNTTTSSSKISKLECTSTEKEKKDGKKKDAILKSLTKEKGDLQEKVDILTGLCKEKSDTINGMEKLVHDLETNLHSNSTKIKAIELEVQGLKIKLKEKTDVLKTLKSSATYQSLRRKKLRLQQKENKIRNKELLMKSVEVQRLKGKIKCLQRKMSAQTKLVLSIINGNKKLQKDLKDLKVEYASLDFQHAMLVSDQIELRGEGQGRPFKENVEKCVMELCCEYYIPTTKVGGVLGTVCKWLFNKENIDSVPSAATANIMVDRAQVLSKLQVAECMLSSERWDLHGDGTSRDGNKIIGQQVTLQTGQTLSGGFHLLQ